jgi:hypothetical protein
MTPDPRPGTLQLVMGDDGMAHLQWKDRRANRVETDLLALPESIVFKRIRTGRDADRVYELRFTDGNRRMYFWMQEPSDAKDAELASKLVEAVNNPAAAQQAAAAAAGGGAAGGRGAGGMAGLAGLGGMDANMLSELMG